MGIHAMYDAHRTNPPTPVKQGRTRIVEFVLEGVKDSYYANREQDVSKYVAELQDAGATSLRVLYRATHS